MVIGETPKEKKKRIIARNKRHNLINLMSQQHESVAANRELSAPELDAEEELKRSRAEKEAEEPDVWSARIGKVRNRLTGKKKRAKERWNRFAGTSGGGGRGR
ncbi:MAG: hypothetical protein ACPG80_03580 [Rickettsiales bacterium]